MIALFAMAIGFGAIVAFSPTKLAIAILYLSGAVAPVARAVAFTIGNTAVIGAVATITYAGGLVAFDDPSTVPPTARVPRTPGWPNTKLWAAGMSARYTDRVDSPETAAQELALWFGPSELVDYERDVDRWVMEG